MALDALGTLDALNLPVSPATALATLPESVRAWFGERFTRPTTGQRLAWPALAAGKNLFLCAPTGTGKTLAAFLPIVSCLLSDPGDLETLLLPLGRAFSAHGVQHSLIACDMFEAAYCETLAGKLLGWSESVHVKLAGVIPGNHDRGILQHARQLPLFVKG